MLIESFEKPMKSKGTMTKEYIEINGSRQGLIIESLNEQKPPLLILHGGPGFPAYPIFKAFHTPFEQYFDVCYWDQRGAGMSYHSREADQPLTLEQMVDDTVQLVHYLRKRFKQEKIYLLGHSWGTYLGSIVANRHPELFHAFIGVGQVGSQLESERETYEFILQTAIERDDIRAFRQINKVEFNEDYFTNHSYANIRKKFTDKYGGGFLRDGYSFTETLKHIWTCPNYTHKERMNILKGSYYSYQSLGGVLAKTDLVELIPEVDVPLFILQGRHDYQTTWKQAKRFHDRVKSPYKKLVTFEDSSHSPSIDEQDKFFDVIQEEVLGIAKIKL